MSATRMVGQAVESLCTVKVKYVKYFLSGSNRHWPVFFFCAGFRPDVSEEINLRRMGRGGSQQRDSVIVYGISLCSRACNGGSVSREKRIVNRPGYCVATRYQRAVARHARESEGVNTRWLFLPLYGPWALYNVCTAICTVAAEHCERLAGWTPL